MKKYKNMKVRGFELKTVRFVPTDKTKEGNLKPEPFVRNQYEEKAKELEKTNKVTGLWYPHKSKNY
jgi:hypothetical protein